MCDCKKEKDLGPCFNMYEAMSRQAAKNKCTCEKCTCEEETVDLFSLPVGKDRENERKILDVLLGPDDEY